MIIRAIITLIACFVAVHGTAYGTLVVGRTYDIIEKDAVEELEHRAASVDWQKLTAKAGGRLNQYHPPDWHPLPHVKESKTYPVSLVNQLSFDVTDGEGKIIYPAGYSYNPLDYVPLPYSIIVIDGSDKAQLAWAKKQIHDKPLAQVFIVDGYIPDVMNALNRRIYYAGQRLLEKLEIDAVPSIVSQDGNQLIVRQIYVREH